MRSGFARLHPLVDLTFFVLVLAFAMFLSHPAVQLAGLVCAALFALRCTGRGFGRRMAMLLPLMLLEDEQMRRYREMAIRSYPIRA